ncbi:acetyltransferase [Alteromonas gilva]|uniref:acetyltransferase n=1 Tax=Alteromonas gilva TaxID=2987522 RepID=UPI0035AB8C99
MILREATQADYSQLITIWEASVRATHDFLPDSEIAALKPLILEQYFDAVSLTCSVTESGDIVGFCGVLDGNIEMLFVSPASMGKGIGKALTQHAIARQQATRVDVNEQNPAALGFYQGIGFVVTGRSELDGQGNPYPLLHLQLTTA